MMFPVGAQLADVSALRRDAARATTFRLRHHALFRAASLKPAVAKLERRLLPGVWIQWRVQKLQQNISAPGITENAVVQNVETLLELERDSAHVLVTIGKLLERPGLQRNPRVVSALMATVLKEASRSAIDSPELLHLMRSLVDRLAEGSKLTQEDLQLLHDSLRASRPSAVQVALAPQPKLLGLLKSLVLALFALSTLSLVLENISEISARSQHASEASALGLATEKVKPVVVNPPLRLTDVKGCDEVREQILEIISFLKEPREFLKLGARLPRGVLLSGPPGTGKTMLARAIACEANVPFFHASGSEFEEMYVGVGARRIRNLFDTAKALGTPCIVFIDEVDAVGSKRNFRDNSAIRMTLNQLLVELDGFTTNDNVIVICATNFAQSLDSALTRPGRLDHVIHVPMPDIVGRCEILEMYASRVRLSPDVDLQIYARRTPGFSGADLYNLLNQAAVRAASSGETAVTPALLESTLDKLVVGMERRSPMTEEEKLYTAVHESGHALVGLRTKGSDPVHKTTILPRGPTLGITWSVPDREKHQERFFEMKARLDSLMGGRAAEDLMFGHENITSGCSSDLETASSLARRMVTKYGLGFDRNDGGGGAIVPLPDRLETLSDTTRKRIDDAVERLLKDAYQRAFNLLKKERSTLEKIAYALLEKETLNSEELKELVPA